MKKFIKKIRFIVLPLLLTSCNVYQVYDTKSQLVKNDEKQYIFEDENIKLEYDLWGNRGTLAFNFYNKTNKPIFVDWNHSNFIKNGFSFDYYQDQTTVTTNGLSTNNTSYNRFGSNSIGTYNGISKIVKKKPDAQVPPKSKISVYTFNIYQEGVPEIKNNKETTVLYNENNTPLKFRNYIGYSFEKDFKDLKYIDNDFYVNKIEFISNGDFESKYQNKEFPYKTSKFYLRKEDKAKTNLAYLGGCGGGCLGGFLFLILYMSILFH